MAENETTTTETAPNTNGGSPKEAPKEPVARRKTSQSPPKKPLPTSRISLAKQLEILRAYAAASGDDQKAVGLADVAGIANIAKDTISLANRFLLPVGLITKADAKFSPSEAVRAFALSVRWGDETAAHKLAPQLTTGWFWDVLDPILKFGAMQEGEVINKLALAADAAPKYQPQILTLLSLLDTCGLIQREGKTIRLGPAAGAATVETTTTEPAADAQPEEDGGAEAQPSTQRPQPTLSTAFSQETEGALRIMVNINVSMSELRDWQPDRISAFFGGVAQVLSAKADVERDGADA
ncbi:MAG: hypothetical protein IIC88_06740 [Chloroflexi bacterium]|nr:hypothetical protein [Chloroflexota bacterium]